jgi:hypothetical protein
VDIVRSTWQFLLILLGGRGPRATPSPTLVHRAHMSSAHVLGKKPICSILPSPQFFSVKPGKPAVMTAAFYLPCISVFERITLVVCPVLFLKAQGKCFLPSVESYCALPLWWLRLQCGQVTPALCLIPSLADGFLLSPSAAEEHG